MIVQLQLQSTNIFNHRHLGMSVNSSQNAQLRNSCNTLALCWLDSKSGLEHGRTASGKQGHEKQGHGRGGVVGGSVFDCPFPEASRLESHIAAATGGDL